MKHLIISSCVVLGMSATGALAQKDSPNQPSQTQPGNDTQITAKVRQAITQDQTTGTAAQNVRVTSHNGMVTLKGKVSSAQEKDAIVAKAKEVAGDANVKDEISVAKSK